MAFEDCYPVTLDLCGDCVGHIDGDGSGCCHDPHHGDPRPYDVLRRIVVDPFNDRPCATGVRLERAHRDVVAFTAGCTDDDCEDGCRSEDRPERWFTYAACEGCGAGGGDREHYTAWVRRDVRPIRTLTRHGWRVEIRPMTSTGTLYAVAECGTEKRYMMRGMPYGGAERWLRVARFVGTLPVAVAA